MSEVHKFTKVLPMMPRRKINNSQESLSRGNCHGHIQRESTKAQGHHHDVIALETSLIERGHHPGYLTVANPPRDGCYIETA